MSGCGSGDINDAREEDALEVNVAILYSSRTQRAIITRIESSKSSPPYFVQGYLTTTLEGEKKVSVLDELLACRVRRAATLLGTRAENLRVDIPGIGSIEGSRNFVRTYEGVVSGGESTLALTLLKHSEDKIKPNQTHLLELTYESKD